MWSQYPTQKRNTHSLHTWDKIIKKIFNFNSFLLFIVFCQKLLVEYWRKLRKVQVFYQMGSRRVRLPWACEPTARRVQSEGYPCSLHQSRNAPSKCFERRAPRSVPNTAPDPPLPPGFCYPSGVRRHTGPRSRSSSWTVVECGVQKAPT